MRRAVFLLLATAFALGCSGSPAPEDGSRATEGADRAPEASGRAAELLAPERVSDFVAESPDAVIVDVRTEAEWNEGRLPGAVRVELDAIEGALDAGAFPARPDQPVVVYCGSGRRSALAATILARRGYTGVRDLDGGIAAWTAAGLPIER